MMEAPEELSGNALLAWHMFAEQIGEVNEQDRAALTTLSLAWAEMMDCERHIQKNGTVVLLPNKYPAVNLYCKARDKARMTVTTLLKEFSLTPASRAKNQPKKKAEAEDTRIEF
jgi:P27 family predicted phage terminase small subunit